MIVKLRILSAQDVRRALPMPAAIDAMRLAFAKLATGMATVPLRTALTTAQGVTLFMPGHLADAGLAQKIVSVYPGNPEHGLPAINGLVIVLNPDTGAARALLDGGALTAIRTGATAGLATDLLARPNSRVLTLFGAGAQAYDQVQAVLAVRPIDEIRIVSQRGSSCQTLAERLRAEGLNAYSVRNPAEAVHDADIISCVTTSHKPLFRDDDVPDGAHLNLSGAYTPAMQEAPPATIARACVVVVDQVEACLAEAGDLLKPLAAGIIAPGHIATTLGDLVVGRAPGRRTAAEITIFKSVGLAAQDVAAASFALARAEQENIGLVIEF